MLYSIKFFDTNAECFNASECLSTLYTDINIDFIARELHNEATDYEEDDYTEFCDMSTDLEIEVCKGLEEYNAVDGHPLEGLLIEIDNGYFLVQQLKEDGTEFYSY